MKRYLAFSATVILAIPMIRKNQLEENLNNDLQCFFQRARFRIILAA